MLVTADNYAYTFNYEYVWRVLAFNCHTYVCAQELLCLYVITAYRIVQNFHGTKFSRKASKYDFRI